MDRVAVKPEMLRWARERSGKSKDSLATRFPRLELWERGETHPTLKQLEKFAKATHTPVGYLFLSGPPQESVPIPDCRTIGNEHMGHPSPDLLDTIYICQQRQEWFRDFARIMGEAPLRFVGSAGLTSDIEATAEDIRQALGFGIKERGRMSTWTEALRHFIEQADTMGILVMISGIVGSNTRRRLDPDEFRGFALSDGLAPLVFINGADTKAAQMFTLAHELAHIWLGQSALTDMQPSEDALDEIEQWCNRVAAELLVPFSSIRDEYHAKAHLQDEMSRLARLFKVSTLVILRRIFDVGGLTRSEFWGAYQDELSRLLAISKGRGGSFYRTLPARVSKRFALALVVSTLEGQTMYREAFRLLGLSKLATFNELGQRLGVII